MEENQLKNVTIEVKNVANEGGIDFSKTEIIEVDSIKFEETKHLFVKLTTTKEEIYPKCNFNLILKFLVQDLDTKGNPHGKPYSDEYSVDKKIEISYADYFIQNPKVNPNNFEEMWKLCEKSNFAMAEEKIQLPYKNMKIVGEKFSEQLGFMPLNDIEKVDVNIKKYEFAYAITSFHDNIVFIRLQVIFGGNNQCLAKIAIRSQDPAVNAIILQKVLGE